MCKLYEKHGIPPYLEAVVPPSYADIEPYEAYELVSKKCDVLHPMTIKLWGSAEFWTPLEAAFLLSGIDPESALLYLATYKECDGEKIYTWLYQFQFMSAEKYLFLFERTNLAPKAKPIDWIKYFHSSMKDKMGWHGDEHEQWADYFHITYLDNSPTKDIHPSERNTLLTIIAALAEEADYDISKISKTGELIASLTQQMGAPVGATTIETHLKKIPEALKRRTK